MTRRFLVIGSGGREHALAHKLSREHDAATVWVAPGNDGIDADPLISGGCVNLDISDIDSVAAFASDHDVDLTVVGPEAPLCAGIVDAFEARDLPIFGPRQAAAELEASKSFAKEVMDAAGVPTAAWAQFEDLDEALAYVREQPHPLVIKADGLAGGKGVLIAQDLTTSEATLREYIVDARFGEASQTVVIEEFLEGVELSFMMVTDGDAVVPLSTSQDHKKLLDGGRGPNTGGMGAVTPSLHTSPDLEDTILDEVIHPVLAELADRGITYTGFLYAGLMLTEDGPKVLEFNVRLGDPETQALTWAMDADLGEVLLRTVRGDLEGCTLRTNRCACCVVMASRGYPFAPEKNFVVSGLERAATFDGAKVFHAGTARTDEGFINNGGRVLGVTAAGEDVAAARALAYDVVACIDWEGVHVRKDIGRE